PWNHLNIPNPSYLEASATFSNNTFHLVGVGQDIYGTSDQFNFVYQQVSGDLTIVARASSDQALGCCRDAWARAGLMVRESMDPGSKNATVFVAPEHSGFTWRSQLGGSTVYTAGPSS